MDARRFDSLARNLSVGDSRRQFLTFLAALPVLGGLALDDAQGVGRRKRRKENHQERRKKHKQDAKDRRADQRKKQKDECTPEPVAQTCDGKCGPVRNRCKELIDCEPCACQPDPGTCDGACGMVVSSCGEAVDCGPCDCDPCPECAVCNPDTGLCETDPGAVGTPCGSSGKVCHADGRCACDSGQDLCNGVCVNRRTDPANCGTCGNACFGENTCEDGTCTCDRSFYGICDSTCVNLIRHPDHCGACGEVCPADAPDCCGISPQNAYCTNLATSPDNCGECYGKCQNGDSCVDGRCVCPRGSVYCDGICRNLQTDINHCGGCNNVCPGQGMLSTTTAMCERGSCQLQCSRWNYDLNSDPADGCEVNGYQYDQYTQDTAWLLPPQSCHDTIPGQFTGSVYSDSRDHFKLPGFNAATGASPLWWTLYAYGSYPGTCLNDPLISLVQTSGTSGCYTLTFYSDTTTREEIITNGSLVVEMDSGSYSDQTYVYFKIEKICDTTIIERADFGVIFHL